jgi:hypothetical protein
MKLKYNIIAVLLFVAMTAHGQEFSYPVSNASEDLTINIQVGYTELVVTGHSENTIKIKTLKELKALDSRADGLAPVTPWPDNTELGIHISEDDNRISIIKSRVRTDARYEILVPEGANVNIEETEWGRGDFEISGIKGDLRIESGSSDISIEDIDGSIRAETTSGDMIIEMPPPGLGENHEIESVSGTTQLLIAKDAAYSFELSTVSGSIQTDFELSKEIEYKGSTLRRISKSREIETDLNGGGDLIEASTVSGLLKISFIK